MGNASFFSYLQLYLVFKLLKFSLVGKCDISHARYHHTTVIGKFDLFLEEKPFTVEHTHTHRLLILI